MYISVLMSGKSLPGDLSYTGPDSDSNKGNSCYGAQAPGGPRGVGREEPQRGPKGAQEEPRKWARKGPRREEKVVVGVLDKKR
jgi:hypothetical protein